MLGRARWGQHPLNVALLHPPWTMGAAQQRGQEPDAWSYWERQRLGLLPAPVSPPALSSQHSISLPAPHLQRHLLSLRPSDS